MKRKSAILSLAAAVCAVQLASGAATWVGLDETAYYSGPKVTPDDLAGKVVLVDCWGYMCAPCRALLPKMEEMWKKYSKKDFILLGSHCQGHHPQEVAELVSKNKLTYPVYEQAGIADPPSNGGFIPFMYVVDHKGKVVYSGRNGNDAAKAIEKALKKIGAPPSLCEDVELKKYKLLESQLVLGKPVKQIIARLSDDIKRCSIPSATASMREQAEEAQQLLDAIEAAKASVKEEIEAKKTANPVEALTLVRAFLVSFPEESADYRAELPELTERARTFKAPPAVAK